MSRTFRSSAGLIAAIGIFLSLAPLWAKYVQTIAGHGLFTSPSSIILLGLTLLVALASAYFLPDFLIRTNATNYSKDGNTSQRFTSIPGRWGLAAGLLSLLVFIFVLFWINRHILHSFLSSADEHSCYFLAECLRKGKLYVDIPPLADFFKVVHVGMRNGKWFSVYPPGWPLIWAFGLQFGITDWLNPFMSGTAIFVFYFAAKRLFDRSVVILGLLFCCLTPFFLFTGASYFSHATCLLCISVFLYAFLRWQENYEAGGDPVGWAALCAFAVGYGLMTRYLTMAAVAAPFLLYHFWHCVKGVRCSSSSSTVSTPSVKEGCSWQFKLRRSDWIFISVVVLFMTLILYQNYLVTGRPFRAPNKYDKSWERLGFRKDYTPVDAVFFLFARVFYLVNWSAPAIIAAYLFSLFRTQSSPQRNLLKALSSAPPLKSLFRFSMVFLALAYFFYYSWGGNQWGPRYWWEGMPFLCISAADWIVSAWRNGSSHARKFLWTFSAMAFVTSGMTLAKQADYVEESSRQRKSLYVMAEQSTQKPAIVFIHGFLGSRLVFAEEDAVRNSPFLDSPILYAHDLGIRNRELMAAYPARTCYRGSYDASLKKPVLEKLS